MGGTGEAEALVKVAFRNCNVAELNDVPLDANWIARHWTKVTGGRGDIHNCHGDPMKAGPGSTTERDLDTGDQMWQQTTL